MIRILTIFLLLTTTIVKGQSQIDPRKANYSVADSIAINFPFVRHSNHIELAMLLTQNLTSEHEKFRVIFRWITENIKYSYSNRSSDPNKALKKKKAVCIGYSTLLREMCLTVGIECEVISGFSKTEIEDIGKKFKTTDHAWNAVKIYDTWYLVDVTWASGYYDKSKRKSFKKFNELYYLSDPTYFAKKHLPKESHWQLLDTPISKSQFKKGPIFHNGIIENKIIQLAPSKGIVKIRQQKKPLEVKFFSETTPESLTISLGKNLNYYPDIEKIGDFYIAKQIFDKPGTYEMTIFLNGKGVATYKLIVKK